MYSRGNLRLARVVSASLLIQDLSYRDIEVTSHQMYGEGGALHRNTIGAYRKATIASPRIDAMQRLAPFLYRVTGFQDTEKDEIGHPVFEKWGLVKFERVKKNPLVGNPVLKSSQQIDDEDREKVLRATKPSDMPHFKQRYHDYRDIEKEILMSDIPTEELDPVKRLFQLYPLSE